MSEKTLCTQHQSNKLLVKKINLKASLPSVWISMHSGDLEAGLSRVLFCRWPKTALRLERGSFKRSSVEVARLKEFLKILKAALSRM